MRSATPASRVLAGAFLPTGCSKSLSDDSGSRTAAIRNDLLKNNFFKNDLGPYFGSLLNRSGSFAVESGTGMVVVVSFGLLCLFGAVLAWIDIRHGIIPDWLNLTIAGLGLSKALFVAGPLAGSEAVCEGAAIGAIFWLLRRLYFAFRKIQGLGLGDVKFLAAAGIWVGVAGLPVLLLVAAPTALACAAVMQLTGRQLTAQTSMSFGPFLAIGLLLTSGFQQYWPCC